MARSNPTVTDDAATRTVFEGTNPRDDDGDQPVTAAAPTLGAIDPKKVPAASAEEADDVADTDDAEDDDDDGDDAVDESE